MKKSTQTLCVVLIAGILTAVSIGALIAILASDEPTIKDQISQAEQEKLDRQEQYKDLLEIVPERDTIPSRPTLPEPPDITLPGSNNYNSVDTAYEVIISTLKDRAESCELRVGNSIRPKSAESPSDKVISEEPVKRHIIPAEATAKKSSITVSSTVFLLFSRVA